MSYESIGIFFVIFFSLNHEKSVTATKNNTTNYERKIAVEKQVKYSIINEKWRCVTCVQILNYCSLDTVYYGVLRYFSSH